MPLNVVVLGALSSTTSAAVDLAHAGDATRPISGSNHDDARIVGDHVRRGQLFL